MQYQTRLVSHFKDRSIDQHGTGWSELWDSNQNDLWDRGYASPPLLEFITTKPDVLAARSSCGRRRTVLIPGCGRGYDPVMLALHGFEAYGLEISQTAVATARRYADAQMKEPSAYNFWTSSDKERVPAGEVTILEGDYFKDNWLEGIKGEHKNFDAVYDYTFLCALPPELRKAWADRAAQMVRAGGLLICLEFPLWKERDLPGPPWGLDGVYWNLLAQNGNGIDGVGDGGAAAPNARFTREFYIQPQRSYEQGRGADRLSVWRRTPN
ncbi:thiol methyltransferase [Lepidopterella palustris CBS 459.81]|uniref:Thiol methyltransferase n=1 Tax=Lepidopterella palustris CBS 459.81 TaxID=1314670 RepID=A0A8E2DWU2_9PEZI|nr:thiol methyltransferase [Lepidopterella palustris CBS 459.81]